MIKWLTKQPGLRVPDLLTVTTIALVAYAASNIVHEGLGHGGACVALGGRPRVLSSVHFECGDEAIGSAARRGVAAAGTIANVIAGALALMAFKRINPRQKPHAAYFLWLFTTLSLLSGPGYLLFSGIGEFGDWADVARDSMSPVLWRPAMAVFGGALYFLVAWRASNWLRSLVGSDGLTMTRAKMFTVPAYAAGGFLFCLSGLLNPVSPILIALSAAAASFGGGSALLWLTEFLRGGRCSAEPAELDRSSVWIVAGCLVSLAFVGILGPGIRF
jgi:hypothetical protein